MSSKEWQIWCRLCARSNGNELKLDTIQSVSNILQKHFRNSLKTSDDFLSIVCQDCLDLVLTVEKFSVRSAKVNNMFRELLSESPSNDKVYSIRQKYGISDSDDEYFNCMKLEAREEIYLQHTTANLILNTSNVDEFNDVGSTLHTKTEQLVADCKIFTDDKYSRKKKSNHQVQRKQSTKSKSTVKKNNLYTALNSKTTKLNNRDVWCHLCDKTFDHPGRYRQHMRRTHIPDIMTFACDKCPKFFGSEKKMLQHASSHRPVEQKKIHPCPDCDRTFSRAENVQLHIRRVHMKKREYVCEECGKALASKGALHRHQVTHSDARPLKCNDCAKCFKDLPGLKKHSETHSTVSFQCFLCGHRSTTRYTLREHMKVHSDEKRYECQYCGNTFKRYKTLKIHLIQHTGERSYVCPFCNLTFAYDQYLRAHKKKSHPVELAAVDAPGPN